MFHAPTMTGVPKTLTLSIWERGTCPGTVGTQERGRLGTGWRAGGEGQGESQFECSHLAFSDRFGRRNKYWSRGSVRKAGVA